VLWNDLLVGVTSNNNTNNNNNNSNNTNTNTNTNTNMCSTFFLYAFQTERLSEIGCQGLHRFPPARCEH
jgi:hypothetical protein